MGSLFEQVVSRNRWTFLWAVYLNRWSLVTVDFLMGSLLEQVVSSNRLTFLWAVYLNRWSLVTGGLPCGLSI